MLDIELLLLLALLIIWPHKLCKQRDILFQLMFGHWELFFMKWFVEFCLLVDILMIQSWFISKLKKINWNFQKIILILVEKNWFEDYCKSIKIREQLMIFQRLKIWNISKNSTGSNYKHKKWLLQFIQKH